MSKMPFACGIGDVFRPRAVRYSGAWPQSGSFGESVCRTLPTIWTHMWSVSRVSRQAAYGSSGQAIARCYGARQRGTHGRTVRLAVWPPARALCHDARMPPTVLIVDDHPSFRATARALLEAEGFDVVGEADDGADALAMAARASPRPRPARRPAARPRRLRGRARLARDGGGAGGVLVSSRDASDYGDLIPACGARGFVAKGDLSGAAMRAILA